MSDIVENVGEQNSAQSKEAAAPPNEAEENVTTNNVEAATKAVPEAVATESAVDTVFKEAAEKATSPKLDNKKTPVKRTPSKRMSFIERAQKESEELVKNMGGSLEIEGGRKTRSSTRGTPTRSAATATPPPAKKSRSSPASGSSTPTRPRGRGRKIDVVEDATEDAETKSTPNEKKAPEKDTEVVEKPEQANELEKQSEEKVVSAESNARAVESKDSTDVGKKSDDDETDGALETVIEETKSQVASDLLSTEKNVTKENENKSVPIEIISDLSESVKSDSPMDTDDVKIIESATDINAVKSGKTTKPIADSLQQVVKEPTPEPMEIDSSPNPDDDVIEITEEIENVQESIDLVENHQASAELPTANVSELKNNIEKVAVVANNSIAKPIVIGDANKVNTDETTPAVNDSNKTENDLCEPKIATSPPISAANDSSTVTTPQTCN